jgi:hypothetical protein
MVRKKEDPERVKARVKKYLENKQQLLITGLSEIEKESFINLAGLENLSHGKKLVELVNSWKLAKSKGNVLGLSDKTIETINAYISFKGISADAFISGLIDTFIEHDDKYKDYTRRSQLTAKIKALIEKLLTQKPLYKSSLNKKYWKDYFNDDSLKRALDDLISIDPRFETLVLKNYLSLTKSELIELSKFPEQQKLGLLKKTLELTNYSEVKPIKAKSKPINLKIPLENKKAKIENWTGFIKDFNSYLYDYKLSNKTRSKLRTEGKRIRDALEKNREYKEAFRKICERLPDNLVNNFKPMYRQGYFYLYEREIIEISKTKELEDLLLLLYESLRHMGKDEPVTEAKKKLGLV